jgi:DNA-binding beta-propeller fold protein YncE
MNKKLRMFVLTILSTIFLVNLVSAQLIIDTVIGSGEVGYNGDAIKAVNAALYNPMAIAIDGMGQIYIADTQNNRIRKVDLLGVIYTIGGTGSFGYTGDETKAVKVAFAFPTGVAVETLDKPDPTDPNKKAVRVYISDTRNNRIRMINEFGIIRTIAGSGRYGFSGDEGPGVKADLAWPAQISLDKFGNVYIVDAGNHRIRVVYNPNNNPNPGPIVGAPHIKNPKNGYIYTICGTGKNGYGGDGEQALLANLNYPWDVWPVDNALFIADKNNHIIRKIDNNGIITTIGGLPGIGGYYGDVLKATEEKLNFPYGVWSDGKEVYVADAMNSRIRKIDPAANSIATIIGIGEFGFAGDGAPADKCFLTHPVDVIGDGKGNLFICDLENARIRKISPALAQSQTKTP